MFFKITLSIFLLSVVLNASSKKCYMIKAQKVCYKPYYNTNNLLKPILGEEYYKSHDGNIYKFTDEIIVDLTYAGAILNILQNYDVELVDKKDEKTYVLKIKNKLASFVGEFDDTTTTKTQIDHLLSILTTLNSIDGVKLAVPFMQRKYTKQYAQKQQQKVQEMIEYEESKPQKKKAAPTGGSMEAYEHFKK